MTRTEQIQVHTFESSERAYNASQTSDEIRDGDVLHVPSESAIAIMVSAWPTALDADHAGESFHTMAADVSWDAVPSTVEGHEPSDYGGSVKIARSLLSGGPSVKVGDRVELTRDLDRYPHFVVAAGATGVVSHKDDHTLNVKMDEPIAGAETWDNEIIWDASDFQPGEIIDRDLRVIETRRETERTVVNVPLGFSNWGGIETQILLDVPKGTPRETLDAAALTIARAERTARNPALWRALPHCAAQDFETDPAEWGETGRGRLIGAPAPIETADNLREEEIERLREIAENATIYDTEIRDRATQILLDLGDVEPETVASPTSLDDVARILREYLRPVLIDLHVSDPRYADHDAVTQAINVDPGSSPRDPACVAIALKWEMADGGTGETGPSLSVWPGLWAEVAPVEDRWAIRFVRAATEDPSGEPNDDGRESGWLVLGISALGDDREPTADEIAVAVADLISTLYSEKAS